MRERREEGAPNFLWFRALVVIGVLLGILLLTQAVRNYVYVSQRLVREQARREATHFTTELEREIRQQRPANPQETEELLNQLWTENAANIAWARIVGLGEGVVAKAGQPVGDPPSLENLRGPQQPPPPTADNSDDEEGPADVRQTSSGPVLVRVTPLRGQGFGGRGGGFPPGGRFSRGGESQDQSGRDTQPGARDRGRSGLTPTGEQTPPTSGEARGGTPPQAAQAQDQGSAAATPPSQAQSQAQPGEGRGSRGNGRGGPGQRARIRIVEVGAYLDRSSAALDALRTNLIVSCSAGVALLLSMGVLGLRFRHYLRGKQLEEQLALARSVQQDLLPSVDPMGQEMDFAAQCVPAWQVGGDFYDVFEAGPGTVAVVLGDVSGKGLPAALLMGLLHGAVRTSRWTDSAAEHEEASLQLNKLLYTRTSGERYASMFWGCYDSRTHVLRYVNAGHLPPLVVGRGRTGEFSVRRLEEGGPVLGLLPSVSFRHGEVVVSPGELLVLYSDGIEEAMDSGEQQFGEERLIAAIKSSWGKPASMIRDAILENVESFLNRYPAHDDQTLVVAWLRSGQGEPGEKAEAAEEVLVS